MIHINHILQYILAGYDPRILLSSFTYQHSDFSEWHFSKCSFEGDVVNLNWSERPLWPSGVVSLTCLLTLTLALAWSRCPVLYPLPLSLLAPLLRLLLVGLPFPCPAFLMSPANAGSDDDHSPICSPFWFTIRPFKFCNVQKQKVMETDDVHSQKAFH